MAQSYGQITGFSKRSILNKQHSSVLLFDSTCDTYHIFLFCIVSFLKNKQMRQDIGDRGDSGNGGENSRISNLRPKHIEIHKSFPDF